MNGFFCNFMKSNQMKNKYVIVLLVGILFSCKKEEKRVVDDNPKPEVQEVSTKECYQFIQGKDTIQASFLLQSQSVSGDLMYHFFEKDKNNGTIVGTIKGDTLVADYTFMSEGKESVREVAFLRKDSLLVEGFGESVAKDGKMIFKDRKALKFTSNMVLKAIPCK